MKPYKQSILSTQGTQCGDCFKTCIACVFELNPSEVPHFCNEGSWPFNLNAWLSERGLVSVEVRLDLDEPTIYPVNGAYCILSGKSPRGDFLHSVVGQARYEQGVFCFLNIHDPHPSNAFLDGPPKMAMFFGLKDPSMKLGGL